MKLRSRSTRSNNVFSPGSLHGVKLYWNEPQRALQLGKKRLPSDVRTVGQMRALLQDRVFAAGAPSNRGLYYMHRGVCMPRDAKLFARFNIRYDVMVFPKGSLGGELSKTFGHYHPPAVFKPKLSYPELYEVLYGEALFLLQRRGSAESVLVRARAGEKVLIPPNWGHVSMNARPSKTLVEVNLIFPDFKADYKPYVKNRGASHYVLANGVAVKNPHYGKVRLREVSARDWSPKWLDVKESIYALFLKKPGDFAFLRDPRLLARGRALPA
ncbi:glucose-6-phosphate isomerase [Candidatus Micrarchaeota archaeon]|nr:glucose-6-phosphate isomerase [Candidatus Micrarchaeota archaeon]